MNDEIITEYCTAAEFIDDNLSSYFSMKIAKSIDVEA